MQLPEHTPNERHFLSKRQRYQQVPLPDEFSDEELARDWTSIEGAYRSRATLEDPGFVVVHHRPEDTRRQDTATQQR